MAADDGIEIPAKALAHMAEQDAMSPDEINRCPDCGINAWRIEEDGRFVHEDFYVSNELWDTVCPDDDVVRWTEADGTEFGQGRFVICIGCFEKRLGRQLTGADLGLDGPPGALFGKPPSRRYLDRSAKR